MLGLPTVRAPNRIWTRALRSAEFRFDKVTIERRNYLLDAHYRRNEQFYLNCIDEAVGRGRDWLAPQPDVSMSVLYVAARSLERGIDERFSFVTEKAEHYRRTIRDPAFRLIDSSYNPDEETYRNLSDVMDVRPYYPVELLMIDCAWADVHPQPDILDRLRAFDDNGNDGTTHIVVGGFVLLANGGAPADATWDLMLGTVELISSANDRTSVAGDIFAERIMVLQWMDRRDLIRPAWIIRLLRAQRADGGWMARNIPPVGQSNQHTTILAMAAMADFRASRLQASTRASR